MKLMLFDVETANARHSSICQVGWVLLKNDVVIKEDCALIDPRCEFEQRNIEIHGIKPSDVKGAPSFAEYYAKRLKKRMQKYLVLAHNASFDLSAVFQALTEAGEEAPEILYIDTLDVCRALIDTDGKGHKLSDLAFAVGFKYKAHDALADCHALLAVLEHVRDQMEEDDLISMIIRSRAPIRVYNGKKETERPQPNHRSFSYSFDTHFRGEVDAEDERLKGLRFCLTGDCSCPREEVERLIAVHGGKATMQPSGKTDYLVIGVYPDYADGFVSSKQRKCEELNDQGAHICFIDFEQLFEMMGETLP